MKIGSLPSESCRSRSSGIIHILILVGVEAQEPHSFALQFLLILLLPNMVAGAKTKDE